MQVDERWPCPRCGNRRTLTWARGRYHCFNCKHQWTLAAGRSVAAAHVFTSDQLARLTIYREAVRAGFYTDELAPDAAYTVLSRM